MRSSWAEMRSRGASEALLTTAASSTETSTEARASKPAERNAGVISLRSRPGLRGDADIAKGHLSSGRAEVEGVGNVIGLRRPVDLPQLRDKAGIHEIAQRRPRGHLAAGQGRVAGDQGRAVAIDDGDFVDQERVADLGIDRARSARRFRSSALRTYARKSAGFSEPGLALRGGVGQGVLRLEEDLLRNQFGAVIGLADDLPRERGDIEPGIHAHDGQNQHRDDQRNFGFQAKVHACGP